MRLTLRTLLAYLDRILDPADAQELQQKVDESELATRLVQRIERVVHDRATEALDIYATRHGLNANSVAEYLDNQMQPEHVADFERVCLESDTLLAETAACHQILTKVLGQRADVPLPLRERLYALKDTAPHSAPSTVAPSAIPSASPAVTRSLRWDQPATNSPAPVSEGPSAARPVAAEGRPVTAPPSSASQPSSAVGTGSRTKRTRTDQPNWDADERWTTAPDYLKKPRRGRWQPWAIGLAMLACLALAAVRGMGPLDANHPLYVRLQNLQRPGGPSSASNSVIAAESDPTNPSRTADEGTTRDDHERSAADSALPADGQDSATPEPASETIVDGSEAVDSSEAARPEEAPHPESNASEEMALAEDNDVSLDPAGEDEELAIDQAVSEGELSDSELAGTELGAEETAAETAAQVADAERSLNEIDLAAQQANPDPSEIDLDESNAAAEEPTAEGVAASEEEATAEAEESSPDLINPLDAIASNVPPVDRGPITVQPGEEAPPSEVDEPGALGAAEGRTVPNSTATKAQPVTDVGRFLNEQQVLLHFDTTDESWRRMIAGSPLQVGERLLSFPTFRPPMVLASGMQLTMIGPTQLQVMPPDAEQTPFFQLDFGRVTVATFTSAGTRLGVKWGADRQGVVTMDDMTTLALEVQRPYLPGADPAVPENQPHDLLFVYVMSGTAQWVTPEGESLSLSAGKRLALIDDRGAHLTDVSEFPLWIDGRDARARDPLAAQDLAKRLSADRPVDLVLSESAQEKRFEQRSLAVCCLAYLGQFDPLLQAFSDEKLRSYWPMQYEVMAHLMAQGPESVQQLKSALIQHHGEEEGQLMFAMLLGYTPQQLVEGSAEMLVDQLNHPSSAVRFLANQTLRSISGLNANYFAHGNERSRRAAVAKWRAHLQKGKIAYVSAPDVVQLLNDVKPATP